VRSEGIRRRCRGNVSVHWNGKDTFEKDPQHRKQAKIENWDHNNLKLLYSKGKISREKRQQWGLVSRMYKEHLNSKTTNHLILKMGSIS
jgi:hypothetical protein